jgi:hypothetical protein
MRFRSLTRSGGRCYSVNYLACERIEYLGVRTGMSSFARAALEGVVGNAGELVRLSKVDPRHGRKDCTAVCRQRFRVSNNQPPSTPPLSTKRASADEPGGSSQP